MRLNPFKIMWKFAALFLVSLLLFGTASLVHAQEYQTTHTPWSGYWWPYNECGLADGGSYYGHPSPLEKYELSTIGSFPGEASSWYRSQYCNQSLPSWHGHCGHWALASLLENYPILPSSVDNIIFRVGDKKGLLTLMHTNDVAIWANATRPEQFHLWLLRYIKDAKQGFVADMDSSEEVWQYPIYKYSMSSTVKGLTESVSVQVFSVSDFVHPDYMGSKETFYFYTYDLYLNSSGDIVGGVWTGNSARSHPERMYYPLTQGVMSPLASMVDYETVKKIAKSRDDFLEDGTGPVDLAPGTYNLILLDQDTYVVNPDVDATVTIKAELLDGGGEYLDLAVLDSRSSVVAQHRVEASSPAAIKIVAEHPPYTVKITKTDYGTPGIYRLEYDAFREFSTTVPYVPKNGDWSGFTITNFNGDTLDKLELTAYAADGSALQTLLGPVTMESHEKKRFIFDSLPYRKHELSQVDAVRVSSIVTSGIVNLMGNNKGGVAAMVQGRYRGARLVIPDTVMEMQQNRTMFGSIVNESDSASELVLNLYTGEGNLVKSEELTLDPRQSFFFRPGRPPFYSMPEAGWIEVKAKGEQDRLSGYQCVTRDKRLEVNFAQPVSQSSKIVPHIPLTGLWTTKLVVINPGDSGSSVLLHRMGSKGGDEDVVLELGPRQRKMVNLHELFDTTAKNPGRRFIVSLSSDQPFAGYYGYQSVDYEDNVTMPLMELEDCSSALLLPHNTQGNAWWTGVGVFNPGAEQVTVQAKPYGKDGELMPGLVTSFGLGSGEYTVMNVDKTFQGQGGNIAFIRFETVTASRLIGGFYLYGNREEGMCGGHLQPVEP